MTRSRFLFFVLGASALFLGACAQQVGDIDRTQANALSKADFEGEWYIRQTVSDVPTTSTAFFVGQTFDTDKIRFVVSSNALMGYRSYEFNPGASDRATVENGDVVATDVIDDRMIEDGDEFHGQPVIGWEITDHFDVQRKYDSSTGEETNVIEENRSDRPWYDREHMRVNWSAVVAAGWFFLDWPVTLQYAEYVGEGEAGDDEFRIIRDEEGKAVYIDFVTRHHVEPSFWSCIDLLYQWGIGDCTAQQVEVRTSLRRVPETDEDTYEPVTYDDVDMNRFGYFRTERQSYDRRRGATMEGRLQFANRHNIWEDAWVRDDAGRPMRDESGKRIAMPFAQRTPAPVVYHLSPHFPEGLLPYAAGVAAEWDRSYRRAVAAAQNDGDVSGWEDVRPMYILCNNPVAAEPVHPPDAAYASDCGEVGDEVRIGDLRYDVMYWVNNPQMSGPLGYGPSAPDPETGEIISGTAYVYGASVDTYAQYALDVVRFANGDLTPEDIDNPEYVRDMVREMRDGAIDPRARGLMANPELADIELPTDPAALMDGLTLERVEALREDALDGMMDSLRSGPGWEERRIRTIEESGIDLLGMNDELIMAARVGADPDGNPVAVDLDPTQALSDADIEVARITNLMRRHNPANERQRALRASRDCVLSPSNLDDSILGIAEAFLGRTDYDEMYAELRGLIFKAVMEHEVGHTVGLRHNFGGSWDSLNYLDEYWDAKIEGYPTVGDDGEPTIREFGSPFSLADVYGVASQTPAQITARMREYQYSSIMDYSSAFNTDFGGVGKYDDAAILYAYTTGVDRNADASSADFNMQERGYVEVWPNLPDEAADIFRQYEDARGIGFYHPLEVYHYTTLVEAMGDTPDAMLETLRDRTYVKLEDLEAAIEADVVGRPFEVPYIFCSDEYRGFRQSCWTWDRGADPMEQTLDYIERYRRYYYFDNYRRERLSWNTGSGPNRAMGRYFLPLVSNYQRWLLTVAISSSRPDAALDNSWTFAAYAGLNLLAEAATTPSSGYYYLDEDDGMFRLYTSRSDLSVFDVETQAAIRRDSEFHIPEGQGRPKWSDYNADLGYYYARYPQRSGHYLTGIFALLALTQSEASSVGVELGAFEQNYVIPPYLVFEDQLTRLFNGVVLQDNLMVGPSANPKSTGYEIQPRPMLTLGLTNGTEMNPETGALVDEGLGMEAGALDPAVGLPIDVRYSFSEQIYALIWGMSGFSSNYSARYVDQGRVWELSLGETPVLAEDFEMLSFCDPNPVGTGKCYGTLVTTDYPVPTLGEQFIQRGLDFVAEYETALDRGNSADAQSALRDIDDLLRDLNIMISVSDVFRRVF